MDWVNGDDLNRWADEQEARAQLPKFVHKLILATSDVEHIDMPADSGISKSGFDGIVESQTGNAFVPIGKSVWETGCGQKPKDKANEDYGKRKNNADKEKSFIFITPRRWPGKRDWVAEKNNEGSWKEVKAYDADDLATWLEQAPGVELWLSGLIGTRPQGAYDLESWWEDKWQNVTLPKLTSEVILAKRNDIAQKILSEIKTKQTVSIQGPSIESSIAFLAATFLADPEKQSEHLLSRAIIVDNQEATRQLVKTRNKLILIPRGQEAKQACAAAYSQEHIVCVCRDPETRSDKNDAIKIPYQNRYSFQESLKDFFQQADKEKNYFEAKSRAATLTRETGMDLEVLRQNLAVSGMENNHKWAKPENAQDLVAALFVGQWDGTKDQDKQILVALSGKEYSKLESIHRRWRDTPNAPLRHKSSIWKLASPVFAWKNIARQASRNQWNRFEEVAKIIFLDPENPSGGWHQHELKKEGIAQSLAILANRMNEDDCPDLGRPPKEWVNNLVREILKDSAIFAQQSSFLFDLSEAAPDVFLEMLETFFRENQSPKLTEAIAHNHNLLWVLGSLAWVQRYLPRVARCLSHLVGKKNHPYYSSPTPRDTLYGIFLPWMPQTETSAEERIKILEGLIKNNPVIGWQLLMDIFPKAHQILSNHATPIWVDFNPPSDPTYKKFFEYVGDLLDFVAENIGSNPKRWQEVIEHISVFPGDQLPYLRSHIEKFARQLHETIPNLSDEDKASIWESLNNFVSYHRQSSDTRWALLEEDLKPWAELRKSLPVDLISRHVHLFGHRPKIDIPIEKENRDWKKRDAKLDEIRQQALEEICDEMGEDGLKKLAKNCEYTGFISRNLRDMSNKTLKASSKTVEMLMEEWLDEEDTLAGCAISYFSKKIRDSLQEKKKNYSAVLIEKAKNEKWPNQKIANMLSAFPCTPETWELVSKFNQEVEEFYWENRFTFQPDNEEDNQKFIEKAFKFNQLIKAHHIISPYHKELPGDLVAEFLERVSEEKEVTSRPDEYLITEMILSLQEKIDNDRLIKIEKTYLETLSFNMCSTCDDFHNQHLTLHKKLAADPQLFVDYMESLFRKKSDNEESLPEPSAAETAKAGECFYLMQTWSLAPGMQEDGTIIDGGKLLRWIEVARARLAELDRIGAGDKQIGAMLGRISLEGKNGIWPTEAIRNVLEEVKSEDMMTGILIGECNMRGARIVSGWQEQLDSAEKYETEAQQMDNKWPETAKLLKKIAADYRADAQNEKTQTEIDSLLD